MTKRRIFDQEGHTHFVTFSCYRRRRLLDHDQAKRIVLGGLSDQLKKQNGRCAGFVVMPDHVHAIVWFPQPNQLATFMKLCKQQTSLRIKRFMAANLPAYVNTIDRPIRCGRPGTEQRDRTKGISPISRGRNTHSDRTKGISPISRFEILTQKGAATPIATWRYIGTDRVLEMAYQNGLVLTHMNDTRTASANQPGMPAGQLRGYDGVQNMTAHRWLEANLDANGFVTSYVSTTSVVGFQHAFDAANNKLSEARLHDSGNSEAYDYDSAYRLNEFDRGTLNSDLTEVTTPTTTSGLLTSQIWNLDGPGNWDSTTTTEVGGSPTTEDRTHNNLNQISAIDSASLVYDANGNLTDDGTYLYAWDAKNRLRTVTRKSDSVVVGRYSYDALGRRILRVFIVGGDPAKTVNYYLDGQRVIEEREPAGGSEPIARQYTYGLYIDEALTLDRDLNANGSTTDSGERVFYHANSLYSIFGLSDSSRNFPERYFYDAYGRPIVWLPGVDAIYGTDDDTRVANAASTVQNVRVFTGREMDGELGLLFYRGRFYSPMFGRFVSRDPITFEGGDVNLYGYVLDAPTIYVDPMGLRLSIVDQPEGARDEVLDNLRRLCPAANLTLGADGNVLIGDPSACNQSAIDQSPNRFGCSCLCTVVNSNFDWEINPTIGFPRGGRLHPRTDSDNRGAGVAFNGYPGYGTGGTIYVPSSHCPLEFGAYDPEGNPQLTSNLIILAHELCGHAAYFTEGMHDPRSASRHQPRPGHDQAIRRENEIRREQGIGCPTRRQQKWLP